MSPRERLESLLARYVEPRVAGAEPPDPEELCSDAPELLAPLKALIRDYESLAGHLAPPTPEERRLLEALGASDFAALRAASAERDAVPREPALTPGSRFAGRYGIEALLGIGGMGQVFRARDLRLGRDVAIKVLPAEVADDEERVRRFEREAQATAALAHPNVVAIHDVGTHEGTAYLVEELLDGESLKDRLARGSYTVTETVKLGIEIAHGLAAAHERGIVHRDLKPGNVFLTREGVVKLLDFGLAKLLRPPPAAGRKLAGKTNRIEPTRDGMVLGTLPYMAPEQAACKAIDARADVFALGVVLYEMLAGRRPFDEDSESDTLAAILKDDPPPLPKSVPARVASVVERCLEKEPARRYADARELRDALEALGDPARLAAPRLLGFSTRRGTLAVAAAIAAVMAIALSLDLGGLRRRFAPPGGRRTITSLAVLPFENLSGDPGQEYLAEGVQEELIGDLARLSGLERVISRDSAMRFEGRRSAPRQLARDLGVEALVTGSVLRAGDRLRITAHLIDAQTGSSLWTRSYDRSWSYVLSLEHAIVEAIGREIGLQLTTEERERLASAPPVHPAAYDALLRGRFQVHRMTPEGFEKGIADMERAIAAEPGNPLAYAALAFACTRIGPEAMPDAFDRARGAIARARELGGALPEAEAAQAAIALYSDWNWPEASRGFRLALELEASLVEARADHAWYLFLERRIGAAREEMQRAIAVDPLNPLWVSWLAWQSWWSGRHGRAEAEARRALELDPDFPWALHVLGGVLAARGKYDEALSIQERAAAGSPATRWGLAHTLALAGRPREARAIAAELEQRPGPMDAWGLAAIHAALGDRDAALGWLEKAIDARCRLAPWIELEPAFSPLREDARFAALVRRVHPPAG